MQGLLRALDLESDALRKVHLRIQRQIAHLETEERLLVQMRRRELRALGLPQLEGEGGREAGSGEEGQEEGEGAAAAAAPPPPAAAGAAAAAAVGGRGNQQQMEVEGAEPSADEQSQEQLSDDEEEWVDDEEREGAALYRGVKRTRRR